MGCAVHPNATLCRDPRIKKEYCIDKCDTGSTAAVSDKGRCLKSSKCGDTRQAAEPRRQPALDQRSERWHPAASARAAEPAGRSRSAKQRQQITSLLSAFPSNKLGPRERGFFLPFDASP